MHLNHLNRELHIILNILCKYHNENLKVGLKDLKKTKVVNLYIYLPSIDNHQIILSYDVYILQNNLRKNVNNNNDFL